MEKKIFQTAVIGLGRIAWSDHLPVLAGHPLYRIAAVADPLRERGEEAVSKFGAGRSFDSITAMLERETPDLAVVCSPTVFHAEQTIQLLEHGVNVFCDKPAASNSAEVRRMFDAAHRNNRKLMIFQPRRVFPNSVAIREIIRSGKLGKIYQLKFYAGNYVRRNDWQAFRRNGGGMLRNYGAHYIDQMMYLTGEKPEILACGTAKIASLGDADDVVKILMRAPKSGILQDLDINQASGFIPYLWAVYGSCGAAFLEKDSREWTLHSFDPKDLPAMNVVTEMAADGRRYPGEPIPFRTEKYLPPEVENTTKIYYDNLAGYLNGTADPLVPESDTLDLMDSLERCEQLAEGRDACVLTGTI